MRLSVAATLAVLALALTSCERETPPAGEEQVGAMQQDRQADPDAARPPDEEAMPARDPVPAEVVEGRQVITISVTADAFEPPMIELEPGMPADLTFIRTTDRGCGDAVQIPAYDVESTPLPLNQPVTLTIEPSDAGVVTFTCGMDMLLGRIVVNWR